MCFKRRWYTVPEIAVYLDMHVKTVYDLIKMGKIPSVKIKGTVMVDKKKLDKILDLSALELLRKIGTGEL